MPCQTVPRRLKWGCAVSNGAAPCQTGLCRVKRGCVPCQTGLRRVKRRGCAVGFHRLSAMQNHTRRCCKPRREITTRRACEPAWNPSSGRALAGLGSLADARPIVDTRAGSLARGRRGAASMGADMPLCKTSRVSRRGTPPARRGRGRAVRGPGERNPTSLLIRAAEPIASAHSRPDRVQPSRMGPSRMAVSQAARHHRR